MFSALGSISWTPGRIAVACAVVLAFALPPFFGTYYHFVGALALINVIIAVGLNLLTGNAGQISMCQSSFMAIGAYTTTFLTTKVGISYWIAMPSGALMAAAMGLALGFPALALPRFLPGGRDTRLP